MGGEAADEVIAVHEADGRDPVDGFGDGVLGAVAAFVVGVLEAEGDSDVDLAPVFDS